jgi:hypothetical protein
MAIASIMRSANTTPCGDAGSGIEIGVIGVEHGAVADRVAQVGGAAAACEQVGINAQNAATPVEAHGVIDPEIMPLAGHHHVFVAVEAALGRTARHMGRQSREAGPLRGLALLATEGSAHAAALHRHARGRQMEHVRHEMLHLGRMLRRAMQHHAALLLRHGEAHLAFKVEMFLATDAETFRKPLWR